VYEQIVKHCFLDWQEIKKRARERAVRLNIITQKEHYEEFDRIMERYKHELKKLVRLPNERLEDISLYDVMKRRREFEGLPFGRQTH
jgi:hypothetical protein